MNSKKVLLGLILAAFVGSAGIATAQVKANYHNNLIEIGPDNIGGRCRALVLDTRTDTVDVLYAGGVAGGLYKRTTDTWDYVPYYDATGKQITLPISYMIQTPNDNNIIIATGEGLSVGEKANSAFIVPKGRGLFRFNPANQSFTLVPNTDPASNADWTYINKMAYLYRDNYLYLYVGTNAGLFRWKIGSESDWNTAPTKIYNGPVQDVEIVSNDNMAFFTSGEHLYKVGNVTAQSGITDISSSNSAFRHASRIEIAAAHSSDTTYLYAVVADSNGLCGGIFLTYNQQTWQPLASSTVAPFNSNNPGWHNISLTVDPKNHKCIYVGGAAVWKGEGHVPGAYYQWNKVSYTEEELSGGNYMGYCYSNSLFCHSGIHEILPYEIDDIDGNPMDIYNYYVATDGGVYNAYYQCGAFTSISKGFNTVQFNDFAVSPDGSIIGGAIDNSCPFIQSRNAHYGGQSNETWYTNENDYDTNRNSIANIIWFGNGGQTAASMFQRILPNTRRGIFTSAAGGDFMFSTNQGVMQAANFGRACTDYSDYTNTQTWTIGESYISDGIAEAHDVPHMVLWETTNNPGNDVVSIVLDTLTTVRRGDTYYYISSKNYYRRGTAEEDTIGYTVAANGDITYVTGAPYWAVNFQIQAGDVYVANSRTHYNYPFDYTFPTTRSIFDTTFSTRIIDSVQVTDTNRHIHTITTHNPLASHMFVNGKNSKGVGVISMNINPNDYSRVWTVSDAGNHTRTMEWLPLYRCDAHFQPGVMAVSPDGDNLYYTIYHDSLNYSMILRMSNIMGADFADFDHAKAQLSYEKDYVGMSRITRFDTIALGGQTTFDRPVTSISVDPRNGHDALVITFGGEGSDANLLYVENASDPDNRTVTAKPVLGGAPAVYSSLILAVDPTNASQQAAAGTLYAGTDNGLYTMAPSASSWSSYGDFDGVPVTAIHQQLNTLAKKSYIGHTGINAEQYLFAATKFPYALYYGTYGRGIFMDATYVNNTVNDVIDDEDYELLDIPQVESTSENTIAIYPNPVSDYATIDLSVYNAGRAVVKIYDLTGKVVYSEDLGILDLGAHALRVNCQNFRHGMYLVNVTFGNETATSKLIVR